MPSPTAASCVSVGPLASVGDLGGINHAHPSGEKRAAVPVRLLGGVLGALPHFSKSLRHLLDHGINVGGGRARPQRYCPVGTGRFHCPVRPLILLLRTVRDQVPRAPKQHSQREPSR